MRAGTIYSRITDRMLMIVCVVILILCVVTSQAATVLIKEDEALREDAPIPEGHLGGFSRRPEVVLLEPADTVTAPFGFVVRFKTHGGAKIAVPKIRVFYHKKGSPIDVTPRLQMGLSGDGIAVVEALAPPGRHTLRVEIEDNVGQREIGFVTFTINK
jgi:hypothetical protein